MQTTTPNPTPSAQRGAPPEPRCPVCEGHGSSCCGGHGTLAARNAQIARFDAEHFAASSKLCRDCGARFLPNQSGNLLRCRACADARARCEAERFTPREPEGHDWETWVALQWRGHAGAVACCAQARLAPCVCNVSTLCPEHGRRCWGSHE